MSSPASVSRAEVSPHSYGWSDRGTLLLATTLFVCLTFAASPSFAQLEAAGVPGGPAIPWAAPVVREDLSGRLPLTQHFAELRTAEEIPCSALDDGWSPTAWIAEQCDAFLALGYEVVSRTSPDTESGVVWQVVLERSGLDQSAPCLSGCALRQFVSIGFHGPTRSAYRRYSELASSSSDLTGALTVCLSTEDHREWSAAHRRWAQRQFERKWASALSGGALAELRAFSQRREQFLHPYADLPIEAASGEADKGALEPAYDPLWNGTEDPELDASLADIVRAVCKQYGVPEAKLSAAICDLHSDQFALHNGDVQRYAGCVPKIIILLAAFEEEAAGRLTIDENTRMTMVRMLRLSAMPEAGAMARRIGIPRILEVTQSPQYRLYDRERGGLWTGRYYHGHTGNVMREPVGGYSHGVTARQAARFYWLLDHGRLVSPEASERMRRIFLDGSVGIINHAFVAGLSGRNLTLVRKSGTYQTHHNDTAMVTGPGRHYIMVCLVDHPSGQIVLQSFAKRVDDYFAERGAAMMREALGTVLGKQVRNAEDAQAPPGP